MMGWGMDWWRKRGSELELELELFEVRRAWAKLWSSHSPTPTTRTYEYTAVSMWVLGDQ